MNTEFAKWVSRILENLKEDDQDAYVIAEIHVSAQAPLMHLSGADACDDYDYCVSRKSSGRVSIQYLEASYRSPGRPVRFMCKLTKKQELEPVNDKSDSRHVHWTHDLVEEGPPMDMKDSDPSARVVSMDAIRAYIRSSGDLNSIHQGKRAIVPAVVLIDEVLSVDDRLLENRALKFKFKKPLRVNELWMYDLENHCGKRVDETLFTVRGSK